MLWGYIAPLQAQKKSARKMAKDTVSTAIIPNLTDEQLMDLVQQQTFRYFWDFGHPVSGLSRERSNIAYDYGDEVVTTGGTGFGIMAILVAAERGWVPRDSALARIQKMVSFLSKAEHYHGIFAHWLNGSTGKTIPFSRKDDGADIVESAYLFQGMLCARQYFNKETPGETRLRNTINWLWNEAEWDWHTQGGRNVLYWHWSPNNGWSMNFEIRGFNECLIAYVMAASSTRYPIKPDVYHQGWANSWFFRNGKSFYGIELPLGFDYGGPLFFSHYSFLGLDPRGLKDRYADYWIQTTHHVQINRQHCIVNPNKFKGYSADCWGLTASDTYNGYNAHAPDNDNGTISPTAALLFFSLFTQREYAGPASFLLQAR